MKKINYDKAFKDQMILSLKEVRKSTNEEWLKLKVRNFVEKHGISSFDELMQKIKSDDVVAAFFAKDPSKQGLHENTAHKFLEEIFGKVEKLPKSGDGAKYVKDGVVINNQPDKSYKSIDFIFNYKGYTVVCSHKYTKEAGGAQDNQRNDLISFVKHSATPAKKHIYVALADGEYYQLSNQTNMKAIQNHSKSPFVFCSTTDDLQAKLDELI